MPARPKRPRISMYGFIQPGAAEERQENRRVRHQVNQVLARVSGEDDAYDLEALPCPRHSSHSQRTGADAVERRFPGAEWEARHLRQRMWKKSRRSTWKHRQKQLAERFWNNWSEPVT